MKIRIPKSLLRDQCFVFEAGAHRRRFEWRNPDVAHWLDQHASEFRFSFDVDAREDSRCALITGCFHNDDGTKSERSLRMSDVVDLIEIPDEDTAYEFNREFCWHVVKKLRAAW